MNTIHCPHKDATHIRAVCIHLLEDVDNNLDQGWQFTGIGRNYNIICEQCRANPSQIAASLRNVCLECYASDKFYFVVGEPEISKRDTRLHFEHTTIKMEGLTENFIEVKPVYSANNSLWIGLTTLGTLIQLDFSMTIYAVLTQIDTDKAKLELDSNTRLYVSADGMFAAIVERLGIHGLVIDLNSGKQTISLERDPYHPEHCPFPVAFFVKDEKSFLVHATGWNRLDISDPATGQMLTKRTPTSYRNGEPRPEHYLDYFHCALTISPNATWIAEDGWVWHPFGEVVVWNLDTWLHNNVWESEDGKTRRVFSYRDYFWNGSLCWIDDNTLASYGVGNDDLSIIRAARIVDVRSGKELSWFPGPDGEFVYDEYLFSFSSKHGMLVWDIDTGEQLLEEKDFIPNSYHPQAKQFLTLLPNGDFQLSRIRLQ